MFNLPGRGFRQRITLTSSVPMTLNDVIVHVRQFVIALVSVDGCSSFPDPDGFFDVPNSSVGFLVYNFHSFPVYDVVFSCRMVCKGGFIDGRHQSCFPLLVYFSFFVLSTSFLCSSSRVFRMLCVVFGTSKYFLFPLSCFHRYSEDKYLHLSDDPQKRHRPLLRVFHCSSTHKARCHHASSETFRSSR